MSFCPHSLNASRSRRSLAPFDPSPSLSLLSLSPWQEIKTLTALTCVAMQPELAAAYRQNFPRKSAPSLSVQEAAEPSEQCDNSHRAFQVLGIDILIDRRGKPRLLEVNSNPSLAIDFEHDDPANPGSTLREPSPVDILVKRRVITDVLRHVVHGGGAGMAAGGRRTYLEPVVGGAAGPVPREWTLLDRARRVYTAAMPHGALSKGMGSSQFVRLLRSSGVLEATTLSKTDAELLFVRITQEQFDHRSLGLHSFARALAELADLAFKDGCERADRFEALMGLIAGAETPNGPTGETAQAATAAAAVPSASPRAPDVAKPAPDGTACAGCGEAQHLPAACFCHRCGVRMVAA